MLNRISRELTQRPDRPAARAMLFAAGLSEADLERPQVGIVSSGFEGNSEDRPTSFCICLLSRGRSSST